ncbi:MAG: anaerobic ribonucleoside-triphosphate reductase activating protein [Coriobacteriales bacterium]|nr:anaerobic ribonucleoside-triphosphate reductase activating protein [Coriobacteriales bacterium]MDO5709089.1 anaerobic ribonucleoside-triphosphate reductase activating protein [Coriobacteriales bacterium]
MISLTPGVGCQEGGRRPLRIGGITPFSTVDWPGKLACVAFLAGCPWDCPYCQNHVLRSPEAGRLTDQDLFDFLAKRRGLLDGVVFSGGEPLVQAAVIDSMRDAKAMGFEVGLHTCGAFPERLREALTYVDWVGLDIKAPWDAYDRVTRGHESGARALESLTAILESGVEFEARTTWHPVLLSDADIATIGHDLADRGVRTWAIQAYRSAGTTGELPDETVYPPEVPADLPQLFENYEFRRA